MADQPIDKIYIDIEVKNTGLNTLKTATKNLQDVVTDINMKGIDVNVTNNTLNTISRISSFLRDLWRIKDLTSKPINVDIKTTTSTKEKGSGRANRTGNQTTRILDANENLLRETQRTVENGLTQTVTKNSFNQVLKETGEFLDEYGRLMKVTTDHTKNLTDGIAKNTYAVGKNGQEWLKTSTTQKQTQDGLLKITTTYDRLGKEISSVSTLTDQFGNVTTKTSGELKKSERSLKTFANGITGAAAKLTILGYGISQISSLFSGFINQSNSYIENLNLFQVTFGNMADEAQRFAENYSAALGLDVSNTLRDMAVFNQIVTGFGVSREEGYQMSKLLTQLSYDLSSFMNIDFEDAVLKFQSGIAGELEPLRRVGYALDEATLQQVAYNHGITESIRTMTQQEKAYIRLIAMYEQSANVMGDLAGTIDSPANAIRILRQQFTQLQRAIGNAMVPVITKLIPIIQGATKALTEFFNMIAERLGYEVEGTRENAYADYMDEITTSAEEAENAINGTLLSFDKFSVLNTGNNEDENFTLPIPEYDALATLVDSLADKSESFQKTYDLLSSVLFNEDKTDFSDTLKSLGSTIMSLTSIFQSLMSITLRFVNEVIVPLIPLFNMLLNILSTLANIIASIVSSDIGMDAILSVASIYLVTKGVLSLITGMNGLTLAFRQFLALHPTLKAFFRQLAVWWRQSSAGAKALAATYSALGIAAATGFGMILSELEPKTRAIVGIITTLISVLAAAAIAWLAYHGSMTMGAAIPAIVTSVAFGVAGLYGVISGFIEGFATGGFTPKTSGSLFMAGENGRPELMGTVGGKNAVANVNSIETAMEQASYRGMVMAINQSNQNNQVNDTPIILQLDGKEIARANVRNTANALSRNYRIELNPR